MYDPYAYAHYDAFDEPEAAAGVLRDWSGVPLDDQTEVW